VVILAGVSLVVAPAPSTALTLSAAGIAWAVVAAFGQGAGVVLSKTAMSEIPIFAASFLRQAAAVVALLVMLAFNGQVGRAFGIFTAMRRFKPVVGPSVLSAYIGFSLMMAGVAWTPAAIAAVLLATTPIFGLFVDVFLDGGRLTWRGVTGTLIAVGGVALLALG
jgi:drug/metabolite transporter (DMT)-like permease